MPEQAPKAFIGVDGGASKTRVVAVDAAGEPLGEAVGPAATLNGTAETAWATLIDAIRAIDALADIPLKACAVQIGIAGTELVAAYRAFLDQAPALAWLDVVSDAHTACAGAHDLGDGAIVAVGTGVVGFCRDRRGTARAGGWGFPHDDRGSGAWLGLEAISHALAVADGRRAPDELADRVLLDFDHVGALAGWACAARAGDFAAYARVVVDLAATGEPAAEALLAAAGRHVSEVAHALVDPQPDLRLALTGGLADTLAPRLDHDLRERLRPPRHDGAWGAALMARQAYRQPEALL